MGRIYRVAIIGAGIGAEHFSAYQQVPERFEVSHICDLNADRAEPIAMQGPISQPNYQAILDDPAIDIVDICLPPHLHLGAMLKALQAKKIIICEKPLVGSLAEFEQLTAMVDETGGQVFPVFQYRFGKAASQLGALQSAGLTGKPFVASLETHWDRDDAYYAVDWRGTWAGEQGGCILGHAIHIHDWVRNVFGPVASVHSELATRVNDIEVEDCAALSIRMECGALVSSSITLGAADNTSRMRFCFADLTAESGSSPYKPAEDKWQFLARGSADQAAIDHVCDIADVPEGFAGLFVSIADALDGTQQPAVTLEDARASIEFVTGVYASSRTGRRVEFPLNASHELFDGWVPNNDPV